jgi:hypothetical protein
MRWLLEIADFDGMAVAAGLFFASLLLLVLVLLISPLRGAVMERAR